MCSGSLSGMTGSGCCQICATYAQTAQQTETQIYASTARLRESQWMLPQSPYGQEWLKYNIKGQNAMMDTTYSDIIGKLEHELDTARNSAAGYADMGDTEGSIFEDGVVAGISRALDIVKKGQVGNRFDWRRLV